MMGKRVKALKVAVIFGGIASILSFIAYVTDDNLESFDIFLFVAFPLVMAIGAYFFVRTDRKNRTS